MDEKRIQEMIEEMITKADVKFRGYRYHYVASLFKYLSSSSDVDKEIKTAPTLLESSEKNKKVFKWRLCSFVWTKKTEM